MPAMAPLLQYGLTGLAAILAYLSYQLLVKESDTKSPRRAMLGAIKSFSVLALLLALVSACSNAFDTFYGSSLHDKISELEKKLSHKDIEIEKLRSKDSSANTIRAMKTELDSAKTEITRLTTNSINGEELSSLRAQLEEANRTNELAKLQADAQMRINTRLIASRLLSDLSTTRTGAKTMIVADKSLDPTVTDETQAHFRLLERAVFKHVADFEGNADMLSRALAILEKQGRAEVAGNADKLVRELPRLVTMRLRWLEDKAIPALRADIELLSSRPLEQRDPIASVPIPEALWLFNHSKGMEPTEPVDDIAKLESDLNVLRSLP